MGCRHRRMYYLTGLPGWMRFGYSPGWVGRSPTGLPPTAQWLMQSGLMPQYLSYLQTTTPTVLPTGVPPTGVPPTSTTPPPGAPMAPPTPFAMPFAPALTKEQERQMLEQQVKALEAQLNAIRKRLDALSQ